MKKNSSSKKFYTYVYLIGIIMLVVGSIGTYYIFFGANSQSFSITSLSANTVYIPVFSNTECTVIAPDYTETYDWADRQNSEGWITEYCSRNDHEVYTNKCELELVREEGGFFSSSAEVTDLYVCPVGTSFGDKDTKCSKKNGVFGTFSFTNKELIFARARDSFGFGEVEENEIQIKKVANWYGLKSIDSNNYLAKEVTCDVSRIKNKGFTFLKEELNEKAPSGILEFNSVMNYISASRPTISKNVIEYKGKEVWTIGNQEYCNIKQDDDGIRFVDITDCKTANDLICNPALSYCSDDATTIINIDSTGTEGKTCNELYGGFANQYVPNAENPKEVCKTSCVDDKLEKNSCKAIPECDEGILNSEYVCVTADVSQDQAEEPKNYLPLVLLIVGLIIIGLVKYRGGKKQK